MDIDAELAEIKANEAKQPKRKTIEPTDSNSMHAVVTKAFARVERAHRLATEHVEIKTFTC